MIRLVFFILAICVALPAAAQDDDRSRLVQMLENALSNGAGGQVRIEGFEGALSSTARLERLTIEDEDGVWLSIEEAELVWTRSALLRGALEIDRLAARRITLSRLPPSQPSTPDPEATAFQLPELPVSIALGELLIEEIALGDAILGTAIRAEANGTAELAEGDGAARFSLTRIDGTVGVFSVEVSFSNETNVLEFDLSAEEEAGGIAATKLNIPQAPALALSLTGTGPLDDFSAEMQLTSDGAPRLAGQFTMSRPEETPDNLEIVANLGGDLATLFLPEYRSFFGESIALTAEATAHADGRFSLDDFTLDTHELQLSGHAEIDAAGRPEQFLIIGQIASDDGAPVRLPVSGAPVTVGRAGLVIGHNRAEAEAWRAGFEVESIRAGDITLESGSLDLQGLITLPGDSDMAINADLIVELRGLALGDPALDRALGPDADLGLTLNWQDGAAFVISDLIAETTHAVLSGQAAIDAAASQVNITTQLQGLVADLSPFSDLAGQTLGGAGTVNLALTAEALSGAFSAEMELEGQDVTATAILPDALLAGESRITLDVSRDAGGLELSLLNIETAQLTAQASGHLTSDDSQLHANARLADAGLFTDALTGPVTTEISLIRELSQEAWQIEASAEAAGGITTNVSGTVGHPDGTVHISATGQVPLALADTMIAPQSVRGVAEFDLNLNGMPGLPALTGRVRAPDLRVLLPDVGIGLSGVGLTVDLSSGSANIAGSGQVDAGGRFEVDGAVNLASSGYPGQISARLFNVIVTEGSLFQTEIETGNISVAGAMTSGPAITGEIVLGETQIQLEGAGSGSAEPIPEIIHTGQSRGQYMARLRAGLISQSGSAGPALPLDLLIRAPQRIFIRGRGLDAELGGQIRVNGTSAAIVPSGGFELIRGRLSLLGQRFDLSEATVSLRGSFDPYLRVLANTEAGDALVTIQLEGLASAPELSFSSTPDLPEDEILALMLFGRDSSSLSAVQAIQLVDAVSGLAGSGSLIAGLRNNLGVDDLDLTTDDQGNAELRLGRYISENIYTDVELGSDGDAELSINIDLTPNILGRGSVDSTGNGSVGVFFERDY